MWRNIETGRITVLRLTAAHDVGKAINPSGCEGQIEGALIQGLGTAVSEELIEANGQLENGNLKPASMALAAEKKVCRWEVCFDRQSI